MKYKILLSCLVLLTAISCDSGSMNENRLFQTPEQNLITSENDRLHFTPSPNSTINFEFDYPSTWEKREFIGEDRVVFTDELTPSTESNTRNVIIDAYLSNDVEKDIDESIQYSKKLTKKFKDPANNPELEETEIAIDGRRAKVHKIRNKIRNGDIGEVYPRYMILVFLPTKDRYYVISIAVSTEDIEGQMLKDFLEMLETIDIQE